MAERLVLHIGVQKSGTTYLQQMMQDRTKELAALGALYPVPPRRRPGATRVNYHETASYALLRGEYSWVTEARAAKEQSWWENLQKQIRSWEGTAIVSAEALSVVRSDAARKTIEALGSPDTRVFITGRGLGKLLPSVWQQHIRNGKSSSFHSYLRQLQRQREAGWDAVESDGKAHLWRAFALGGLARRWASIVGTDKVTLITNPGSPADRLWHRFLEAVELGDTSSISAPDDSTTVHSGVTAPEAEVLRTLNSNLAAAEWPADDARRLRARIIEGFARRPSRGPRLGIPLTYRETVDAWSRADVEDLRNSGVRIVGDTGELRYSPAAEPAEHTAPDVAEAAGSAAATAAAWSPGLKNPLAKGD
ncbi:hypothetical protein [Streptomonospora wellingtoniae]|uniref:Sulfotransferase family protein n=1 Tax=Streptomonospora wellingtoniae TaxID=3075544 RepID=A0ABU2KR02_9ACTN|nr:hypothetical protein [Streptomonospora sp. DSM 45055]MDT0301695.1 hypothetical protein [Streptomonospora sp. DSM 45055]